MVRDEPISVVTAALLLGICIGVVCALVVSSLIHAAFGGQP